MPDTPHTPVLLPVPGRSRASSLPRPAARISTIVRRSASYAVLDAQRPGPPHAPVLLPVPGRSRASSLPRPAARISTIVRHSASYAVLGAQRPGPPQAPVLLPLPGRSRASSLLRPESQLSCDAPRRMPFWTLRVLSSVPLNHPTLRVNSSVNALAMGDCSSLRCTSHTALVAPGSRTLR